MNTYPLNSQEDCFVVNEASPDDYSQAVCMDLLTDFGFKHIFGKESHKDILIEFLNVLFQGRKVIHDLHFNNNEQNGPTDDYRTVHFDLICTGENGEQFIIEMQRANQAFFMDRCLFYNARLLIDQAPEKGNNWNYELKGVFTISILEEKSKQLNTGAHYLTPVELINTNTQETFCDKTGYIFLELSKFDKTLEALESDLERWCYVLKHLHQLKKLPRILDQKVFQRIFKLAQLAQLPKEEQLMYDRTLKAKRDWHNMLDYAQKEAAEKARMEGREEGIEIGIEKGNLALENKTNSIAIKLIKKGMELNSVMEITGLTLDQINKLMNDLDYSSNE
jgi:predicted transposase/invertase (TIGR01784 family)